MKRQVALVLIVLLGGCTSGSQGRSEKIAFVGSSSFMAIPVQPWFCDETRDGYCPTEPRELPNQTQ